MARITRITSGFALVGAGIVMLATPGPGIITIVGGLAVLSKDYVWAARLADWTKERFRTSSKREGDVPLPPEKDYEGG